MLLFKKDYIIIQSVRKIVHVNNVGHTDPQSKAVHVYACGGCANLSSR